MSRRKVRHGKAKDKGKEKCIEIMRNSNAIHDLIEKESNGLADLNSLVEMCFSEILFVDCE